MVFVSIGGYVLHWQEDGAPDWSARPSLPPSSPAISRRLVMPEADERDRVGMNRR